MVKKLCNKLTLLISVLTLISVLFIIGFILYHLFISFEIIKVIAGVIVLISFIYLNRAL